MTAKHRNVNFFFEKRVLEKVCFVTDQNFYLRKILVLGKIVSDNMNKLLMFGNTCIWWLVYGLYMEDNWLRDNATAC